MSNADNQREALSEIMRYGRDIVTVTCADRLLAPFGFSAQELGLIYEAEKGVDWGVGVQRWESGPQVNVCTLAYVLADRMNAPEVKYDTDFGGMGKRAQAVAAQAVLRLRKMLGEVIPTCDDCNTASIGHGSSLCFSCRRRRDDAASYAVVLHNTFPNKYTFNDVEVGGRSFFEVRKGSKDIWPKSNQGDMLSRFHFVDQEYALQVAYAENIKVGLHGPVQVKQAGH